MTTMYSFSGETTVLIMALAQVIYEKSPYYLFLSVQVVVASLALGLSLLFFLCKLGQQYVYCCYGQCNCFCFSSVSCRVLYAFSNVVVIIGYIITYPFPFSSNPMQSFNGEHQKSVQVQSTRYSETTRTGCNPLEYSWCDRQLVKWLIIIKRTFFNAGCQHCSILDHFDSHEQFCDSFGSIEFRYNLFENDWKSGPGIPMQTRYCTYSNIQNLMQSLFVIVDDIVQIVGPLYGASV